MLSFIISGKMDILIISESNSMIRFPQLNFISMAFHRLTDMIRIGFGGGVLVHIREDIPSKELKDSYSSGNIESIFVEINLHKKKRINGGTYNPNKNTLAFHLNVLKKCLMQLTLNYDNFVILGDFNSYLMNH